MRSSSKQIRHLPRSSEHINTVQSFSTIHLSQHLVHDAIRNSRAIMSSVCQSLSEISKFAEESTAYRLGAIESNSSKKRTHGLAELARSKMSRTCRARISYFHCEESLITDSLFTGTNVFVQNLWSLYSNEIQPTLFCYGRCQQCLPTSWVTVK